MAHYIKQDEATAITADVPNESGKLGFGQVMTEMHTERYVRAREWVADDIGAYKRNVDFTRFTRIQVDSNHFNSKPVVDFFSDETAGTP